MPLPEPAPRKLSHTRTLSLQGYERADGLWDIEGHIVDVKPHFFSLSGCVREAGEPIHEMRVRLTIDRDMKIHDAVATSEAIPYRGHCDSTLPDYGKLVGLNLGKGFRRAVLERMGGVKGCTHITEMLTHLPSAAFQVLSSQPHLYDPAKANFAVGRCVGLQQGGETVKQHYPQWYVNTDKNNERGAEHVAVKSHS